MFSQRAKNGDSEVNGKEKEQIPRINMARTTCNECGDKGHYDGNSECYTQNNPKEDA